MLFEFESKPFSEYSNEELVLFILKCAALGAIVLSIAMAPNMAKVFAQLGILDDPKKRRKVVNKFNYLRNTKKVTLRGSKYVVTPEGKKLLDENTVWNLKPSIPKKWDGKWHLVLFDVPAKKERARQALRARLQELGLKRFQNSVFISKFSVQKEVEAFARFYRIRDHINFVTASDLL